MRANRTDLATLTTNLSTLAEQLARCQGLALGRAFLLTFGKATLPAIRYSQERETPIGCDAYARGERTYTDEALYVLGDLPASYLRSPGGKYTNGPSYQFDVRDDASAAGAIGGHLWYVACHSNATGPHFILHQVRSDRVGAFRLHKGTARTL